MKTIKKFKLSSILAVLAVLLFVATAWALVANNAFATDDETAVAKNEQNATDADNSEATQPEAANEAEDNASHQISFNIKGLAAGDTADWHLTDDESGTEIPYNLGDKLTVDGDTASVDYKQKGAFSINVEDGTNDYLFATRAPLGYKFKSFEPADEPEKIDSNIDFSIVFEADPEPYTIKVRAQDSNDNPLSGSSIRFFNRDCIVVAEGTTDADGYCKFDNLTAYNAVGTILVETDGLADGISQIDNGSYHGGHEAEDEINIMEKSNSNCVLENNDHNHEYFKFVATYNMSDEPSFTIQAAKKDFYLSCDFVDAPTWQVKENGNLFSIHGGDELSITYDIAAVGKSGFQVSYWLIGAPESNTQVKVYPGGDPITLASGEMLYAMPVYAEAPQPGPEPTPEITAQTGDSAPLVPFVLLAVLAGGVLLYTRKLAKN